jgi:hypothetical protein
LVLYIIVIFVNYINVTYPYHKIEFNSSREIRSIFGLNLLLIEAFILLLNR